VVLTFFFFFFLMWVVSSLLVMSDTISFFFLWSPVYPTLVYWSDGGYFSRPRWIDGDLRVDRGIFGLSVRWCYFGLSLGCLSAYGLELVGKVLWLAVVTFHGFIFGFVPHSFFGFFYLFIFSVHFYLYFMDLARRDFLSTRAAMLH